MSEQQSGTGERLGFGLGGNAPIETIATAALEAEQVGYDSFWLSNPGPLDLAPCAAALSATSTITVGVGVIPLSHASPDEIAAAIGQQNLPLDRFVLGVGSGSARRPLGMVRSSIDAIKAKLDVQVYIAALGERMTRLAGEAADGVVLNWLTPEYARRSAEWARSAAREAGRPAPWVVAYVRVALGEASLQRLEIEAARYTSIPHYGKHFERMGIPAAQTAVSGADEAAIHRGLEQWQGVVDEVVVRALPANDRVDEALEILRAAAPGVR